MDLQVVVGVVCCVVPTSTLIEDRWLFCVVVLWCSVVPCRNVSSVGKPQKTTNTCACGLSRTDFEKRLVVFTCGDEMYVVPAYWRRRPILVNCEFQTI